MGRVGICDLDYRSAESGARICVERVEEFAASPGGDQSVQQTASELPAADDIISEAERDVAVGVPRRCGNPLSEED